MLSLVNIGLMLITVAWVIQYSSISKRNKEINKNFVFLYMIGALILAWSGFSVDAGNVAFLNLFTVIGAGFVFYKLKK